MKQKFRYSFKGITYSTLGLFGLVGGIFAYWNYHFVDNEKYRQLLDKSNPVNASNQITPYQATQDRSQVQKELVFNRGGQRLTVRLISDNARMVLDHNANSHELVESMQPVRMFMQEELYYVLPDGTKSNKPAEDAKKMQTIRYIEADEARYYYKSDRLTASHVKMFRFEMPGHELSTDIAGLKPTLTSEAELVDLNPKNTTLNLSADQFKATLIDDQVTIKSDEAFCKNGSTELFKNVKVDHQMGTIQTHKAVLNASNEIDLQDGVDMVMPNGNTVNCDHARMDTKQKVAHLYSGPQASTVTYTEKESLTVSSKQMQAYFNDSVNTSEKNVQNGLSRIEAQDQVKIQYKDAFVASSDQLFWDLKSDLLTLKDHVHFDQDVIGRLSTEREVKITRSGKSELESIQTQGKSILVREQEKQIITCYGDVAVDHLQKTMTLESPKDEEGNVAPEQQVQFEDPTGAIYADRAVIFYRIENGKTSVDKIVLQGQVRILNQPPALDGTPSDAIQYALADELELVPGSGEMTLNAYPSKRVLFYDKSRDLKVSAPLLKIKRDGVTKKDSIKGSGDVRFNFVEQEFDEIKRRFAFKQQDKK